MLGQAEHRRAFFRLVTTYAFKKTAAVMDDVRKNVNVRFVPLDKLAVHPDIFFFLQCHYLYSLDFLSVTLFSAPRSVSQTFIYFRPAPAYPAESLFQGLLSLCYVLLFPEYPSAELLFRELLFL